MAGLAYVAVIEKGANGFGAFFPDVPGCVTAGDTIPEVIMLAYEALALHLAGLAEDGIEIPKASPLQNIKPDKDIEVAAIVYIAATPPGPAQQIRVRIDKNLLQKIDELSGDRSQFLNDAVRAELARRSLG